MAIPRAVLEQAERAEALHLALINGNTAPATPEEHQMTPPAEATKPVVDVTPAEPVVAPPEVVVEAAPEAAVPDSWELKYKVLDGKYRSEVPRMAAEIRDLKAKLAAANGGETPAAAAPAGEARKRVAEQYGDDFADAVASVAAEKTEELRQKVEKIDESAATRARGDFIRDLTGLVPAWQEIDADPGFTAYLDEFDAMTGRTRREFFVEADTANDAARIASFFVNYSKGKKTPPAPKPVAVVETPSVEHLVVPDSSNHAEAAVQPKVWTRAEAAKFYKDARAQGASHPYGRYTAAEYKRISAEIDAAIAEGRLRG